jgi:hypothetical protein
MDVNDFKLYSVKVQNGSGVLFQPMNKRDYTYVLTAKHNLLGKKPSEGDARIKEEYLFSEIDILIQNDGGINPIKITLVTNENYFPHKEADIAILKIDFLEGYEKIYINSSFT